MAKNDKTQPESSSTDTNTSPSLPQSPNGNLQANTAETSSTGQPAGDNYLTPRTAGDNRPANDHSTAQDQGAPKGLTQTEAVASTDQTATLSPTTPAPETTSASTRTATTSTTPSSVDLDDRIIERFRDKERPPLHLSDTIARFPLWWENALSAADRKAIDGLLDDAGLVPTDGLRATLLDRILAGEKSFSATTDPLF
jgi:hypothetical protein